MGFWEMFQVGFAVFSLGVFLVTVTAAVGHGTPCLTTPDVAPNNHPAAGPLITNQALTPQHR